MAVTIVKFKRQLPVYHGVQWDGTLVMANQIITFLQQQWPNSEIVKIINGILQWPDPTGAPGWVPMPTGTWVLICRSPGLENWHLLSDVDMNARFTVDTSP